MTLFNKIQQVLGEHKLSLENICGQSYVKASNMKGSEKGLQALFKNIIGYADYAPCAVHSLNPVEEKAMSTVPEVVDYFGILQELYVFFTGSPQRWGILNAQGNLDFSLKSLSITRWSAHYEVVWAIKMDIWVFYKLSNIFWKTQKRSLNVNETQRIYTTSS